MTDIHFINNPIIKEVLNTILSVAGDNFTAPYDSLAQPSDATAMNQDTLLQFQLPAGASLQGYADSASYGENIGNAINSMLASLAPFLAAFGMIIPILNIIKAIIEVLCALINPFAVIRALIKLFSKYIPPLISLFPPLAGIVLLLSLIKAIIAIVFYILSVILPIIELVKHNIQLLRAAFGPDGNKQQKDAGREKLLSILIELINQLGVLNILKPILDIIFAILGIAAGFPCGDDDSECCGDNFCPPALKREIKGRAIVVPVFYGEAPPGSVWKISILDNFFNILSIIPYMQNFKFQLDSQLDEPIDEAETAGQEGDTSHFKIILSNRRGSGTEREISILKLNSPRSIIVMDPTLNSFRGAVNYEIVPNWNMLVKNNIVGLGCHPDITAAKDAIKAKFPDLTKTGLELYPAAVPVRNDFINFNNDLYNNLNKLRNEVMDIVFDDNISVEELPVQEEIIRPGEIDRSSAPYIPPTADDITRIPDTNPSLPPYDLTGINNIENDIINLANGYLDNLHRVFKDILLRTISRFESQLQVDKNIVVIGGRDKVIVYVTPRDASGLPAIKNMPNSIDVDVSIYTTMGTITNQNLNRRYGVVTAELSSLTSGTAVVTAKINDEFISDLIENVESVREVSVRFVSDAVLPKRRLVSKLTTKSDKMSTARGIDREPGAK